MSFTKATNTSAYLKMGLLGFQGSGKTRTATNTAIGLIQHLRERGLPYATKPAKFIDTETGSDWVIPLFAAAGIPLDTWKTRAFSDLVEAVKLSEQDGSLLLVDSVTHFWTELCTSFSRAKAKRFNKPSYRLQINDWQYLKGPDGWGKFADLYVNSSLHIILAGRAGYEFDMSEDDDGNKELLKTGVKMKAEGEFGFEPSLLVYMERHQKMTGDKIERVWREATVMKDRAGVIDGMSFENPDFASFLPHIERLNLGGRHLGVDISKTSEAMIPADPRDNTSTHRAIVLNEIEDLLTVKVPGSGAKEKAKKITLLATHFNASWTEMEKLMPLFDLRAGYDSLHRELEGKPSRYTAAVAAAQAPAAIDDELPAFLDRNAATPAVTEDASTARSAPVKPPEPTLKQRLMSDIPNLKSFQDCTLWGFEMGHYSDQLPKVDQDEITSALMARQRTLMNGHAEPVTLGM